MREPVEGAHPHPADRPPQQGFDTGAHLRGGLVGKGDCKYAEGRGLLRLQVPGDTMYQHPGFTAAGPGQHQDIAGWRRDNLALRLIQPV